LLSGLIGFKDQEETNIIENLRSFFEVKKSTKKSLNNALVGTENKSLHPLISNEKQ